VVLPMRLLNNTVVQQSPGALVALFLDAGGLADPVAEVVQLGATHITLADDFDVLNDRRVEGKDSLDADAKADLPHVEGRTSAIAALASDDHALVDLDTFAATLNDANIDTHSVTRRKFWDVIAQLRGFDLFDRIHRVLRTTKRYEAIEAAILPPRRGYRPTRPQGGRAAVPRFGDAVAPHATQRSSRDLPT
jgi:hypothetical protein